MTRYKIPEPLLCFDCERKCYARGWSRFNEETGEPHPDNRVIVDWQCSKCGRRFDTSEYLDSILVEVGYIPTPYEEIKFIEIEENGYPSVRIQEVLHDEL